MLFKFLKISYVFFKYRSGPRSTSAKGKESRAKHTYGKQSFSRVISLWIPALLSKWMNLK